MEKETRNDFYDQPLAPATVAQVFALCGIDDEVDAERFHVLDFGAGGGRYLAAFATRIPKRNLAATEVDDDQVERCRARGFACAQLDLVSAKLPFPEGRFDVVFSSNVIEHILRPQYLAYLEEIARVLKPGGRFVVGTPNYPVKRLYDLFKAVRTRQFRYYFFDDPTHVNLLSFRRLEADLKPHFREIQLDPTYLFLERKIGLLRRPRVRRRLRRFGDKIIGVCVK